MTENEHLDSIVENKTTFTLNNCEFSLFETHKKTEDVKLKFNDLTFTAMLRGKKHMKLEDKSDYFDYFPGETGLVSPGETMVIDFPEADENPSQCIALSFSPDFVEDSLNSVSYTHLDVYKRQILIYPNSTSFYRSRNSV